MSVLFEPAHDTVGGSESVCTSTGEENGIDLLHRMARIEQIGLTGAGTTSSDVDGGDSSAQSADHRASGGGAGSEFGGRIDLVVMPHQ